MPNTYVRKIQMRYDRKDIKMAEEFVQNGFPAYAAYAIFRSNTLSLQNP